MEEKIKTLSALYAAHFTAELDRVRLRTGKVTERIKIDHPAAAAILPFIDPAHILLVRQWRYALGKETLELPAGKADPGEELDVCALRELEEETGYRAERLIPIFNFYPAIGYSNELIRIYGASGLTRLDRALDEDEIAQVEVMPMDHVLDLILSGVIHDSKSALGILLFQARQARGEIPQDFFG